MKVIEYSNGSKERRILTAMIVNDSVLAKVAEVWADDSKFSSPFVNKIGQWCVDFYTKYKKAPRKAIQSVFEEWEETQKDEDSIDLLKRLLTTINGEYEQASEEINEEHTLDIASKHFNRVKLTKLKERMEVALAANDPDKAQDLLTQHKRVEIGGSQGRYTFHDKEHILELFNRENVKPLVEWPGAIGDLFQDHFQRDSFIAFEGLEKRGKSWWLAETAHQAICQRRKVAFFSVGDLAEWQMEYRLFSRVCAHPTRNPTRQWPYVVEVPVKINQPGKGDPDGVATVDVRTLSFSKVLDGKLVLQGIDDWQKKILKSRRKFHKMLCVPSDTMTVQGIRGHLQTWEQEDFYPDVIIIDYADILAPPKTTGRFDKRDQINATWSALRALSLEFHCLVVTATQSSAKAHRKKTLDQETFSEDKRKRSHVTGVIGLNQTSEEKKHQLMRLNWIMLREGESHVNRCVTVAQCLPLANPCVISSF